MNGRRYLDRFFNELVPQRREGEGTDMASFFARETTEVGDVFLPMLFLSILSFYC